MKKNIKHNKRHNKVARKLFSLLSGLGLPQYYLYTKTPKELWAMGKMISIKVRAFKTLTDAPETCNG